MASVRRRRGNHSIEYPIVVEWIELEEESTTDDDYGDDSDSDSDYSSVSYDSDDSSDTDGTSGNNNVQIQDRRDYQDTARLRCSDYEDLRSFLLTELGLEETEAAATLAKLERMFSEQEQEEMSAFFFAAQEADLESMTTILSCVKLEHRIKLIAEFFNSLRSFCVHMDEVEAIQVILGSFSFDDRMKIVRGAHVLHITTHWLSLDCLRTVLQLFVEPGGRPHYSLFHALQTEDSDGLSPIHWALIRGSKRFFHEIKRVLDGGNRWLLLLLVDIPDCWYVQPVSDRDLYKAGVRLTKYKAKALIERAIEVDNTSNDRFPIRPSICGVIEDNFATMEHVKQLIEECPVSVEQIKKLSPFSTQYIIPHTTRGGSKPYGLILYNTHRRHGAVAEADDMVDALEDIGCHVEKREWVATTEVRGMIDRFVTRLVARDNCCLLFVCITSHGYRGMLRGEDGTEIPINTIIKQLKDSLPAYLPLVLLVQACQQLVTEGIGSSQLQESDPAIPSGVPSADIQHNKHIVLTRPHTVLLTATVTGGEAVRGAFTGAVANQIRNSDGEKEVGKMFSLAAYEMKRREAMSIEQQPELRSTTDKTLVLPPVYSFRNFRRMEALQARRSADNDGYY